MIKKNKKNGKKVIFYTWVCKMLEDSAMGVEGCVALDISRRYSVMAAPFGSGASQQTETWFADFGHCTKGAVGVPGGAAPERNSAGSDQALA